MGYWCEKCGELKAAGNPFPWIPGGEARAHRAGCPGGRVIPIATICDPPEPTVIDESDLAPGMVVVAVDDHPIPWHWLSSPDARIPLSWAVWAADKCVLRSAEHSMETIRRIAGPRRRC